MAQTIGDGSGMDLFIDENAAYEWNPMRNPQWCLSNPDGEEQGYFKRSATGWTLYTDCEGEFGGRDFPTLAELYASVDPNATIDQPDELWDWWNQEKGVTA